MSTALRLRRIATFLSDPRVPKLPRFALIAAVLYLLSPIDLLPEAVLPVVGWLDDLTIVWVALRWLIKEGDQATAAPAPDGFPPPVKRVDRQ